MTAPAPGIVPPVILALDTSGPWCGACVLAGGQVLASLHEDMPRGQGEHLMAMLAALLGQAGICWRDLTALGVGVGPGNFTGIRIAVSVARGLALGLGIPAVGVSGFEIIVAEAPAADNCLITLSAPRGLAYVQPNGPAGPRGAAQVFDPDAPARALADGIACVLGQDAGRIGACLGLPASERELPTEPAPVIARLAAQRLALGGVIARAAPLYVRGPDAAPAADRPPVILDAR